MRTANILASIVLIGIGLVAVLWIIPAQTVEVDPGELPGSLLPTVAAWLLIGASVWQLGSQVGAKRLQSRLRSPANAGPVNTSAPEATSVGSEDANPTETTVESGQDVSAAGSPALFFVASAVVLSLMLALIAQFGYLIGGTVGLLAIGLLLRPQGSACWWLIALAAVLPSTIYFLAWQLLRLSLP